MATIAEFELFQEWLKSRPTARKSVVGPDPNHRGVVDQNFVMPTPFEFPKMVYHVSGSTKVVNSREEQDSLGATWGEKPAVKRMDWKDKLGHVVTLSGFAVHEHHVTFLQLHNAPGVTSLIDAAKFLDQLDATQQEQFFMEAEDFNFKTEDGVKVAKKKN
jgi:hypothetical protein